MSFETNFNVSWKRWICQNISCLSSSKKKCRINCKMSCHLNSISLMTYTSWRVRHNWKRIIISVLTMQNLVDDRVQSLRSRSKRELQQVAQWASRRSRSRSMKNLNRLSSNRQYEILINIVLQTREHRISLKRLISIRLKRNLWKQINASIATNQIISIAIVQNSENSKLSRWT